MMVLLRNVSNAIWHAFQALHQESDGLVAKTKLKVLTANIASTLDLYGVEKGLEHFSSTSTLNFKCFLDYLQREVFSEISITKLPLRDVRQYEEKIEEICWLICRKNFTSTLFKDTQIFHLFRIYCLFSDMNSEGDLSVSLNPEEAIIILQKVTESLGLDCEKEKRITSLYNGKKPFNFQEFINLFVDFKDEKHSLEYDQSMYEVINDIYQTYIKDVVKKGYLLRKGYLLPTFKEYWVVLQPCELSLYKNKNEKELSGVIHLDPQFALRPIHCNSPTKSEKLLKFSLKSGDRNIEFATRDHKSRIQWITALQLAITYSAGEEGFQRDVIIRRKKKREYEQKTKKEEENNVLKQFEIARNQLEEEKRARKAAEEHARVDSRRVAELEDMKENLEKLLEEEIQAKRDEEIVRALQARVLAEEWEKREELEQLQKEQTALYEEEKQKRIEFEQLQKEKEVELSLAEKKLKELEDERIKLDKELKHARFKIIRSEETKEDLESRIDSLLPTLSGASLRRTSSFVVPSSRDRPTIFENQIFDTRRSRIKK